MRIHVESAEMVNWDNVLEKVTSEAQAMASESVNLARAALGNLKPGERRTIVVKVGSITVSVPK